jgi:thymidine kinase
MTPTPNSLDIFLATDEQKEIINAIQTDNRRIHILTPRHVGRTRALIEVAASYARQDKDVMLITRNYEQAQQITKQISAMFGSKMTDRQFYPTPKVRVTSVQHAAQSSIGYSVDIILVDDAEPSQDFRDMLVNLLPTTKKMVTVSDVPANIAFLTNKSVIIL